MREGNKEKNEKTRKYYEDVAQSEQSNLLNFCSFLHMRQFTLKSKSIFELNNKTTKISLVPMLPKSRFYLCYKDTQLNQ